jgi:uncharacterized protein
MKVQESWFPSHLRKVSLPECHDLLESGQVGRIGFTDPAGQVVLPVNYVMVDGCVCVATSPFGSIARHAIGTSVAFEVDSIDDFTESGWSVVVRGRASVVERDELPSEDMPRPWADGIRILVLKISADEITGRRLIPT